MFDEYFNPPQSVVSHVLVDVTPRAIEIAGSPSSTTTDLDAPSSKGFDDQNNPSHVYMLKKALYGLKQALRAWYDMLSSFLISLHFSKGAVNPTLFTRKAGNDLLQ
ncbi:retrovirus-related pol polyprotein from transposon TNT 1-94, partial [Tanacetum coccineum]